MLEFSRSYQGRSLHYQFSRYIRHLKTGTEKENTEKFITEVWRRTLKVLPFKFCSRFGTKVIDELKIQWNIEKWPWNNDLLFGLWSFLFYKSDVIVTGKRFNRLTFIVYCCFSCSKLTFRWYGILNKNDPHCLVHFECLLIRVWHY